MVEKIYSWLPKEWKSVTSHVFNDYLEWGKYDFSKILITV